MSAVLIRSIAPERIDINYYYNIGTMEEENNDMEVEEIEEREKNLDSQNPPPSKRRRVSKASSDLAYEYVLGILTH